MIRKFFGAKVVINVITILLVCGLFCACRRNSADIPDNEDKVQDISGGDSEVQSGQSVDLREDLGDSAIDLGDSANEPGDSAIDLGDSAIDPGASIIDPADLSPELKKFTDVGVYMDSRDLSLGLMKLTDVGVYMHKISAERVNPLTFEYVYEHNEGFDEFCGNNVFTTAYLKYAAKYPNYNNSLVRIDGLKDSSIEESINACIADVYAKLTSPGFIPGYRGIYAFLGENPTAFEQVVTEVAYNCDNILSILVTKSLYSWANEGNTTVSYPNRTVYYRVPLNFNLETGSLLALADLYPEDSDYLGLLNSYVFTNYVSSSFSFRDEYRDDPVADDEISGLYTDDSEYDGAGLFTGIEVGQKFYIDESGDVVLVFDDRTPSLWKLNKNNYCFRPQELELGNNTSNENAEAGTIGYEVRPILQSVTGLRDIFESDAHFRFGTTLRKYYDDDTLCVMPYTLEMYNLHGNEIELRILFPEYADDIMIDRGQFAEIAKALLECDRTVRDSECEIAPCAVLRLGADCELIDVSIGSSTWRAYTTRYRDVLVHNGKLVGRTDIFRRRT